MNSRPSWKIPVGVSPGLWQYLNDSDASRHYDERLLGTPLLDFDLQFVREVLHKSFSVIDLGCGTGRVAIPIAPEVAQVVGVDLSQDMLRVAREKAVAAGVAVTWLRMNLVELDALADDRFDLALCLFSTLGMISGAAARRQALVHFARVLKPRGRLILHVHNVGFHALTRAGRRWLIRDRIRKWTGAAEFGDYEMPPHRGITGLALHHYSRGEIKRDLRQAGLTVIAIIPVSHRQDCRLSRPWLLSGYRAYGFLIVAEKLDLGGSSR